MMKKAGDLYLNETLPLGDGEQTPDDFARQQSASTGLPEHMCKFNMEKNHFVLNHMDQILDALTRGLDISILERGFGVEERGVPVSYQAQSPVLGMVLPSNSPGVHTLWMPVIPMQIGLVLKPGPQEPWTPYRMFAAFTEAGVPKEAIGIYPGGGDMGAETVSRCGRVMIFGSTQTVKNYSGNDRCKCTARATAKFCWATTWSINGRTISISWPTAFTKTADVAVLTALACGPRATQRKSPKPSPKKLAPTK